MRIWAGLLSKERRRVGPPHAGDPGLRAEVERSGAGSTSTRTHLGVPDHSRMHRLTCALRSIRPKLARVQLHGRADFRENDGIFWNAKR